MGRLPKLNSGPLMSMSARWHIKASTIALRDHIDRPESERRSWGVSNRPGTHRDFCMPMIKPTFSSSLAHLGAACRRALEINARSYLPLCKCWIKKSPKVLSQKSPSFGYSHHPSQHQWHRLFPLKGPQCLRLVLQTVRDTRVAGRQLLFPTARIVAV